MSINVEALKRRLGEISNKSKRSVLLWKPSTGKQLIRIVPYAKDPENPFIEMQFHYGIGNRTYLSPQTYGRPDPIIEFGETIRKTGDKDDYELSKKFFPKIRIYVPVIVRGEEDQGVRYWGFGMQVYQSLLGLISDADYGDIASLSEGNDITVIYKPVEETKKAFPETDILPRPKKTSVGTGANITEEKLIGLIKNQTDITEMFQESTYEDLKSALDKFLDPEETDSTVTEDEAPVDSDTPADSETEKKAAVKPAGKDDWDNLFGE